LSENDNHINSVRSPKTIEINHELRVIGSPHALEAIPPPADMNIQPDATHAVPIDARRRKHHELNSCHRAPLGRSLKFLIRCSIANMLYIKQPSGATGSSW